jgi:NitT/TauT family transport system ATP-binding protein
MGSATSADVTPAEMGASGSGEVVIEARNLTKAFTETVIAVQNANFSIPRGSFVSLVGPSGCGKSTILRLVSGLIDKTAGSVAVHGNEVNGPTGEIGMMFQKAVLLEWRTAIENVLLPTEIRGTITSQDKHKAMDYLHLVGLKDFEFSFPRQLSGGMQQRVALARLLQTGADILLLDEPFGALDEFTRERLNVELLRIVDGPEKTTLFVTHNITEAIFLADYVMVMTPRPGQLAKVIRVPFPRPREIEIEVTPEFQQLVAEVREVLGEFITGDDL